MTVAVYARASIDKTELRISTDRQLDRCAEKAADLYPGQATVRFSDNNLSASDPDTHRPAYTNLLAAIRRGDITALVVHEQSRLTRQPAQWDELVVALSRANITTVHTVLRGDIPVAPGNRLIGRIMAVVDADESERIKLRATAMHEHLAGQGRPNGGRYFGYRHQTGQDGRPTLTPHPGEAETVQRIVTELLAGFSSFEVAARLNNDQVPTGRTAEQWWSGSVLSVAKRPHIAGLRTHRGQVVGEGRWEPLVDRARWEELQTVITARGYTGPRTRRWLLSGGMAVCDRCDNPMVVVSAIRPKGNVHTYACSARSRKLGACASVSLSPAEIVEDIVVEYTLTRLETPDLAGRLQTGRAAGPDIVARLTAAERRVARAAELFGAGEMDEVTWRRMHTEACRARDEARGELARFAPRTPVGLEDVRERWETLSLSQRRQLVELAVREVRVLPRTGRRPTDPYDRVGERLVIVGR